MKKKVIWGAGYIGGKQLVALGKENVCFFIDSSREKCASLYCGKQVIHPDDIIDWKEYYIYVPQNYYIEIAQVLHGKGLKENVDFSAFTGDIPIDDERFEKNYNDSINELKRKSDILVGRTLFWGWNFCQKTSYKKFFERMHGATFDNEIGVIAENYWENSDEAEKENGVPTVMAPYIFDRDCYITNPPALEKDALEVVQRNYFYDSAVIKMQHMHGVSYGSAAYVVWKMAEYVKFVVELLSPRMIIIVGSRTVKSDVMRGVLNEVHYSLMFTHPGFLPGTLIFDEGGDSAEGAPNTNPERFMELPVTDAEIQEAANLIDGIRISGTNRKIQPKNDVIGFVKPKLKPGRPVVFFAAQVDTDLFPVSDYNSAMYSPVFHTSMEAGVYLSYVCQKNDWNYIFKPHPIYIRDEIESQMASGSIYVSQGNINDLVDMSDVVVTIQSSTSYVGLIRNKPVVMLGYDQLRDKGIVYPAYAKEKIESAICNAIEKGLTLQQKERFIRFIAICLKFFLYKDVGSACCIGREVPQSVDDFFSLRKLLS